MICINCGHNNDEGKANCSWCNFPLATVPPPARSNKKTPEVVPTEAPRDTDPTVLEPRTARIYHDSSKPVKGKKTCPQCQYELILDSAFCPMCSFPFKLDSNTQPAAPSIQIAEVLLTDFPPEAPAQSNPIEEVLMTDFPPEAPAQSNLMEEVLMTDFPPETPAQSNPMEEVLPTYFQPEAPAQFNLIEEVLLTDFQPEAPAQSNPMEETPTTGTLAKTHRKSTTTPFKKLPERKMVSNTIDPFRRDAGNEVLASFQPIARDTEPAMDPITVVFSDKPIMLNRAVLEPDNNTITGKVQAELAFRDGAWYLVDRSEQETTFIRASGPVKLQKGDVILMGNRKFKFDC